MCTASNAPSTKQCLLLEGFTMAPLQAQSFIEMGSPAHFGLTCRHGSAYYTLWLCPMGSFNGGIWLWIGVCRVLVVFGHNESGDTPSRLVSGVSFVVWWWPCVIGTRVCLYASASFLLASRWCVVLSYLPICLRLFKIILFFRRVFVVIVVRGYKCVQVALGEIGDVVPEWRRVDAGF